MKDTPKASTKILKQKPYIFEEYKPRTRSRKNFMAAIKRTGAQAMYRENLFGSELIWGDHRYIFPNRKGKKSMNSLYIFAMVKRDALNYLKNNKIKDTGWASSVTYNKKANPIGRKLVGTDIDGAYWHIAYKMGIISDNTYHRGLLIKEKHLLLASLSTLGRDKRYVQLRDGRFTHEYIVIKGDDTLKLLYKKIRYTCYGYVKQLSRLIKQDFVAYKTDCIYYLYSARNVRIVKEFLERMDIDYKMVRDFKSFDKYVDD